MSERKSLEQIADELWGIASWHEDVTGKIVAARISELAGDIWDYSDMLKEMVGENSE